MSATSSIASLQGGLIVSCQAPVDSPMQEPIVIAAMAQAAIDQGAVGVRIESPVHVEAVRPRVSAPIIGLWKQQIPEFEVYITPQISHARTIARAGADIIAIDATLRPRPGGDVASLIARIHEDLGKLVMADVDTLEAAIAAESAGADLVGTTLYGYTAETRDRTPPGFELLAELVQQLQVPVICEGGVASPEMARQAIDLGAYAVVVGTAITGIDRQVQAYQAAIVGDDRGTLLEQSDSYEFRLLEQPNRHYQQYLNDKLTAEGQANPETESFFIPDTNQAIALDIFLLDGSTIQAGLVGFTRWNWLFIRLLWVDRGLRNRGYGARLMQLAEQAARSRGCIGARLNTLSFQSKGFYEKIGYRVVGQVDNYPPGHTHYLLTKPL